MADNFKGFSVYNDLEDAALQAYNRGRMLTNIFLDHSSKGKVTVKGAALSTGYMNAIPKGERKPALESFIEQMAKEGYALGGSPAKQERLKEEAIND